MTTIGPEKKKKRNEVPVLAATWMSFENAMLSESGKS